MASATDAKELPWVAHCKNEAYFHLQIMYRFKVDTAEKLTKAICADLTT
jgi:hypothetical protein